MRTLALLTSTEKSLTTRLICSKIGFIAYSRSSRSSMRRIRAPSFHRLASIWVCALTARHLDHRLLLQLIDQVAALDASQLALSLHLGAEHLLPRFHFDPVQCLGHRQFARRSLFGSHQFRA